jgi:hypothetical protein
MSISQNYPLTSPSLSLDFANTKVLDSRITFSRPTDAVYYDGKTVTKAEENLLKYSQEFDTTWTKVRSSVTSNVTTAPDGTLTADKLVETAITGTHYVSQNASSLSGQPITVSVFAKKEERDWLAIDLYDTANRVSYFDLTNGVLGTIEASTTASILSIGDGWYRCTVSRIMSTTLVSSLVGSATADLTNSYAGDGTSGLYLWGAQLEARDTVTAYQPTTTQPITNYTPTLLTAPSNVARFDHNPVTGESLGLLVEEQRTNLVTYSEDFGNASWVKGDSLIVANTIVAPDGNLTGDKLVENTTTGFHYLNKSIIVSTPAGSIYIKAGERTQAWIFLSGTNLGACIDLLTGTVISLAGVNNSLNIRIVNAGNGWYRLSLNEPVTASAFQIGVGNGGSATYTGDGYSGIYIWGAQLEAGSFPTSYIKTEASQVTRSADSASMTGTNFSDWWRADEGTLYVEGQTNNNVDDGRGATAQNVAPLIGLGDGLTNQFRLDRADAGGRVFRPQMLYRTTTQSLQAEGVDYGYSPNVSTKIASAMKAYDYAFSAQGQTPIPLITPESIIQGPLLIGQSPYVSVFDRLNGTIKKIAYYPQRLTNTQLVALTS